MKVLIKSTINHENYYVHAYETWKKALSKFCDIKCYGNGYPDFIGYNVSDSDIYKKLNFKPDIELWVGGPGNKKPQYINSEYISEPIKDVPKVILLTDYWEIVRDSTIEKWQEREKELEEMGVVGYFSFYSQTEKWMREIIKTRFINFFSFPYVAGEEYSKHRNNDKKWDINLQFYYKGYPFRTKLFYYYIDQEKYSIFHINKNHYYKMADKNNDCLYEFFHKDTPSENFSMLLNSCRITLCDGYTKYCNQYNLDGTDLFNSRYPQVLMSSSVLFCPKIESTHIERLIDGVHYVDIDENNFSEKVEYYLSNLDKLKEISKNANEWAERNCSYDVVGKRIFHNLSNILKKDVLVIIGNGPSAKEVDFEKIKKYDTFCMNSSYRKFKDMNFYPTYFGCFDYLVCQYHAKSYSELFDTPIKKFFFLEPSYFSEEIRNHPKFFKFNFKMESFEKTSFDNFVNMGCTGANCLQIGILLGYKKIILIGCDANYIDKIEGVEKTNDGRLVVKKQPKINPNYWFNDYQQVGDVFNVPNANIYHLPAWNKVAKLALDRDIEVINCSPISKIKSFPLDSLKNVLDL